MTFPLYAKTPVTATPIPCSIGFPEIPITQLELHQVLGWQRQQLCPLWPPQDESSDVVAAIQTALAALISSCSSANRFFFTNQGRPTTKPDGLLFDLDGTLVESCPPRDALDGALKHHGGVGVQTEQILNWIGDGVRTLVARGVCSRWSLPRPVRASAPHVPRDVPRKLLPEVVLSGVRDLLDEAQLRGLPMAICANKDDIYTMPLLLHLDLLKYFSVVKCPRSRKPDADMLQQAMRGWH